MVDLVDIDKHQDGCPGEELKSSILEKGEDLLLELEGLRLHTPHLNLVLL